MAEFCLAMQGSLTSTKPLINFMRGWPNPSLLPTRLIEKASHNVLNTKSVWVPGMEYGPDPGDPRLRTNVAKWLTSFYQPTNSTSGEKYTVTDKRICITGGASQNLASVLQVFTDPGYTRNVWIVAPAYMLAFRIFEDAGLKSKFRAVPEDEQGIDIEFLRRQIRKSEENARGEGNDKPHFKPQRPWGKIYKHIIYAVPTFSNPSSGTMTLQRREDLVRLAREFDALIITDDVYDFLQWPSNPTSSNSKSKLLDKALLPRIVDVDRYLDGGAEREGADGFGNAASNGSFSKICAPGIRTGWIEGTGKLAYGVSQTGTSASGGAPSQLSATFIAEALETGELQRYVYDVLQPSYAKRYHAMIAAIKKELIPLGVRLPQSNREIVGGYFLWLSLPKAVKAATVAQRVKEEENVIVAQGELFEVPGDNKTAHFGNALRVCFAWEEEDKLAEGIERLARVIRSVQDEPEQSNQTAQPTTAQEDAKDFW